MKRTFVLAALLSIFGVGAAVADSPMDEVRAELRRAVAAGEMTRAEARAAMRDAVTAHTAERHARRDARHAERDARKAERQAVRGARKAEASGH
jgi:hypothetical protein